MVTTGDEFLLRTKVEWPHLLMLFMLLVAIYMLRPSHELIKDILGRHAEWLKHIGFPTLGTLIVLFAFSSSPFFWSVHPLLVKYNVLVVWVLLLAICVRFFMSGVRRRINCYTLSFLFVMILFSLSCLLSDHAEIKAKSLHRIVLYTFMFFAVSAMVSMEYEKLKRVANQVILIYLILTLPSIILFICFLVGIELPFLRLDLGDRGLLYGLYYRLYPFGIIGENNIFTLYDNTSIVRLNGFSEEPGVLGTRVVFFIILNRLVAEGKIRMWREWLLHLLGILSFSFFYFVSVIIIFIPNILKRLHRIGADSAHLVTFLALKRRLIKSIIGVVAVVGGFVAIMAVIESDSPFYYLTIARFMPDDAGWFQGDSRSQFSMDILRYLKSADAAKVMFGNGLGANSLDGGPGFASWGGELYNSGLLALAVVLIFYAYLLVCSIFMGGRLNISYPCLLLPAFLSFYQRPETIGPLTMIFWAVVSRFIARSRKGLTPEFEKKERMPYVRHDHVCRP